MRVKRRAGYYHHMLVVRVMDDTTLQVIHYSGDSGGASRGSVVVSSTVASSEVLEGEVDVFPERQTVELLEYPEGVALYMYTGHRAIRRARDKVGEQEYNFFINNCDSFVNWVITNKKVSGQGQKAAVGTGTTAAIGALLMGLGVASALGGIGYALSKENDNAESDSD